MRTKAVSIVALSLHPPNDQISRLRLPLWTSAGKAEPTATMLRHAKAGDIRALRPFCRIIPVGRVIDEPAQEENIADTAIASCLDRWHEDVGTWNHTVRRVDPEVIHRRNPTLSKC